MQLSYGKDSICEIVRTDVLRVASHDFSTIPVHEIVPRVQQALADPMDYPHLASATVPGDRVVVAVEYGVPHIEQVAKGVVASLKQSGIENFALTVLLASEFAVDPVAVSALRDVLQDDAELAFHVPDEEEGLALLGITMAKQPLRLNRVLCDADLVIPIRIAKSSKWIVVRDSFFPAFSDLATLCRFHSPASYETASARQKLAREVEECHWMLGINLMVQVVPGPRGGISAVYCGTPREVEKAAQQDYQRIWTAEIDTHADLVVATIVGDDTRQSWQNVSRALAIADEFLEPGGAIAICTEMSTRPGPSGKRLRDAQDLFEVERKLLHDEFADSMSALELCRSLQTGTVYLKSQLDPRLVESMGIAPIQSDEELERVTRRYQRCLVLEEAQYLEPKLVA